MQTLCEEAAHLTGAIRSESEEESDSGGAESHAAKDPKALDPKTEAALAAVTVPPPTSTVSATSSFARRLRSPATFFWALGKAVLIALVLNVPGIAIPILLIVAGNYALLAAIEAVLIGVLVFFIFRKRVREGSKQYASEAFFRAYASSRGMTLEEPLHFAATHAEAKLPFRPDHVLAGPLPGGGEGCLCILGSGDKRADRIAVVAGPSGPVAESELEAEPQGLSTKDLDTYLEQLAGEAREDAATAPAKS
jgi:hypothetical protein